ncbi:MAG: tetratricopeptide repeat protein [Synechococcaceae cyanobacterium SM2_3_1]|nr:tetratricopeptide repeat protein [Synechococcaceae cyanobacterium SM2_3_1]
MKSLLSAATVSCRQDVSRSCRAWLSCLAGLMLLGSLGSGLPAQAQVLFHSPVPNASLLQAQAMQLAGDSVRLAQFGQMEEALGRLQLAVQLVPESADLQFLMGSLHLELEHYTESVEALQVARDLSPENGEILLTLGAAYLRQGSYFAAVDALEQGVELEPGSASAHFQLGNAYLLRGNPKDARREFEKAFDLDDQFWPAINNLGLIAYEEGDIETSIQNWETAIAIDDTVAEPKLALATALYIKGETISAEELGAEAIQLDPEYARLETLRINLWGPELMRDVEVLLRTETVQSALRQAAIEALQPPDPLP